jgi:hypothetical protein
MLDREDQSRTDRAALLISNVGFAVSWVWLLVHLVQHRRALTASLRTDIEFLMLIFPLLWINLLFERVKGLTLGFVCGAFLGVAALVLRLV